VDLDDWRERGRRGEGWKVDLKELEEAKEPEVEVEEEGEGEEGSEAEVEEEEEEGEEKTKSGTPRKRKAKSVMLVKPKKKRRITSATKAGTTTAPSKGKRKEHPQSSTSNLPSTISPEDLPTDPYQRALRLLHVGATPDSLPCREEEFLDVLSRVEEGVEGGGGGCLCELYFSPITQSARG
jgi:origin recognition complex subunit 1